MNLAQLAMGAWGVAYSGCHFGRCGTFCIFIRASPGVRSAFRLLHGTQASTQFSHELVPPRERGSTWSIVSESGPGLEPQYWQAKPSRRNRFRRLKATLPIGTLSKAVSEITSGTRSFHRTDCTYSSPSAGESRVQSDQS